MELKVSIFDVLTYLLPGLLYFVSFVFIADLAIKTEIFSMLIKPNVTQSIGVLIISYILGHTLQPIYRLSPFVHIFRGKGNIDENIDSLLGEAGEEFNERIKKMGCSSRAIIEKIIQLKDEKLARTSSRFLALSIFMRNLSFPFLLLAFAVIPRFDQLGVIFTGAITFTLIIMSLLSSYRSARYRKFANTAAIEGLAAIHLWKKVFFTNVKEN